MIVSGGGTVFGMGKRAGAHIVWDWNGTLFHDNDAIIGATNAAFAELGLEPITLEKYRALYCVPVPKFYERLLGRLHSELTYLDIREALADLHIYLDDMQQKLNAAGEAIAQTYFVPSVLPPTLATPSRYYEAQQQQQ